MLDQGQTQFQPNAQPKRGNAAPVMTIRNLDLWYGTNHAIKDASFELYPGEILAFIGPSGCGKSTVLKCLNRMHDDNRDVRISGKIEMHGTDIHDPAIDPPMHRRRFGWVAQKPNPFAKSIFENVAYGARIHGMCADRRALAVHVEQCLRRALLWDEVKDDLHTKSGNDLSGGQQQRLCIARALATGPEVLLMDEPTGSIDPVATAAIEELMLELRHDISIVVVTHSMMEAKRLADRVAYFHLGELREIAPAQAFFAAPQDPDARRFVRGKTG